MATKPATLAAFKNLVVQTAELDKQAKQVAKRAGTAKTLMGDAIKKGDFSRVGVVQKAVKADIKAIGATIATGQKTVETLETIKEDEDFVAEKLEAIDKLAELIDASRKSLGESYETLKDLENQGEKAQEELTAEAKTARIRTAGLEKDVRDLVQRIDAAGKSAEGIWTEATTAQESRDAKALKSAATRYEAVGGDALQKEKDEMLKEIAEFEKKSADFDAAAKAMVADALKDFEPELKRAQETLDTIKTNTGKLQKDMTVAPIDTRKALDVLELDAKWSGKLEKALASPTADLEKALGTLAKEAKSDKTGKQMVEALKKAKLV